MAPTLKGVAAAPGIAIASLVHFHGDLQFIPKRTIREDERDSERARLEAAITEASQSILFLRHELSASLSDQETKIYDAQLALLHDQTFHDDLVRELGSDTVNVEVSLQRVIARYEGVFESMEDAAMRERAADVRDVGRQLLSALMARERSVHTAGGKDYIFAANEFLPSDVGVVDREHLRGIVTAFGGKYSHGAILARSLGIPALVGVDDVMVKATSGDEVVLDGESGLLIIDPDDEELERYRQLRSEREESERRVFEVRFLSSRTPDGVEVKLLTNIEANRDLDEVEVEMIHGVGLYRTEFAFMERRQFPTEEEQVAMYRQVVEWADGRVVTFRTLDIGGDKPLQYFRTPHETNPVLGWRGLRISLDWPDLFYPQIRAILRASSGGRARILVPMVTNVQELDRCRAVIDQVRNDLIESGEECGEDVQLGAMVEVPALVHVLDEVLERVDFVSVGTNDLVQYLLAVDRDNPRVATKYTPYHPAVLRVLAQIAERAAAAGKPASICGEIAGDHYYTPLLIGLGFRELSMAPVFLPRVKLTLRTFSVAECEATAKEALAMTASTDVRALAREKAQQCWSRFLHGE